MINPIKKEFKMEELEDFKLCHCASNDCTNCPARHTGTVTLNYIFIQQQIRKDHENANAQTQIKRG